MYKIIIFGMHDFAALAYHYLREEGKHEVVAFCLSRDYLTGKRTFNGLAVLPLEEIEATHPPGDHLFFAPMSHRNLNRDRESIFEAISQKGYHFINYIHPSSVIGSNVEIGTNCMILESNTLQPFVKIQDNVIIWGGNFISHHSSIAKSAFIACNTTIGGHCSIGERSFLGNNCTIRDQLKITADTTIGMGANVVKNTLAKRIYIGNPARAINHS